MTASIAAKLAAALLCAGSALAADDALMRAMRDELARSMKKLQLENLQKPFFVAYRIVETNGCTVEASFGALTTDTGCDRAHTRSLSVEVRVGDYARDSSNFYAPNFGTPGVIRLIAPGAAAVPIDDDYDEVRRQLWLATDSSYKAALDLYAKKKAALENRNRTDDAPDLSKESAVDDNETIPPVVWNHAELEGTVKALSALFRETPGIDNSAVAFQGTNWLTRYINSEGTTFTRQTSSVSFKVNADTQAPDGNPLMDFDVLYARSMKDLPSREDLTKRIRALQSRLDNLRKAPLVERYTGPVLFEGEAAAEIVLQGMASALVGAPRIVVEDTRFERAFNNNTGFADKVGGRVLPDFLSITDNGAAREFQAKPLLGGYQVDEDGVKTRPTVVVDHGILKTLLHTRSLIPGTTQSTASRRSQGPGPSNLLITAHKALTQEQVKAELLRVAKQRGLDFAIVVRRMGNAILAMSLLRSRTVFFTSSSGPGSIEVEPLIDAYKLYPDGREELVRNLTVSGLTLGAFKDIVAVSDSAFVTTVPFRARISTPPTGGMVFIPGPNLVSVAAPALLFDDMTLQRPKGDVPNLPFTKHPFWDKGK